MKPINIFARFALTAAIVTSLTSCATIMHGNMQLIGIASNPSNAQVWIDGFFVGDTPTFVKLTRRDNHVMRIELNGFVPYEAVFTKQLSGWVFGNIIFGGIIGLVVDSLSGAIYRLTPEEIQAELRAGNVQIDRSGDSTYVFFVLEPKASWEKVDQLVAAQ